MPARLRATRRRGRDRTTTILSVASAPSERERTGKLLGSFLILFFFYDRDYKLVKLFITEL